MKKNRLIALALCAVLLLSLTVSFAAAEEDMPTFRIIVSANVNTDDLNENEFLKDLAEQAGVRIEYECVYTDWDTRKSVLLTSGDLPDAFIGWNVLSNSEVSYNLPLFANLGELISEEATPNLYAALESDPTYRDACSDLDGNIYYLSDRMPFRPSTYASFLINKTWLDKLGLEVPETLEELEEVLIAFRDRDPNGNGEQDELPLYMNLSGDEAWSIAAFMGAFGCSGSITNYFALDGDTVVYQPLTENFKEFITWIAHLREENLMPAELATVDDSQFNARLSNETPIVGMTTLWDKSPIGAAYQDEYIAIAPMAGPNGDRGVASNIAISAYDCVPKFVMSADCENKEALMRFIDLCFIPENGVQCFYGPIGTVLEETEDGLIMVDPPEGMTWNSWKYKYAVNGGWPVLGDETFEALFAEVPESDSAKLEMVAVNEPYQNTNTLPKLKFTPEETDELSIVQTDVDTYVTKKMTEWFANGGVEEEWDTYIQELHNMGVDTYVSIYQAAYDRQK